MSAYLSPFRIAVSYRSCHCAICGRRILPEEIHARFFNGHFTHKFHGSCIRTLGNRASDKREIDLIVKPYRKKGGNI